MELGAFVGVAGGKPGAVLLAAVGVAGIRLADHATLGCIFGILMARLPAPPEARAAEHEGVGGQVAVGVHENGADPLGRRAARRAPRDGAGRESDTARELQLARALVPVGL